MLRLLFLLLSESSLITLLRRFLGGDNLAAEWFDDISCVFLEGDLLEEGDLLFTCAGVVEG